MEKRFLGVFYKNPDGTYDRKQSKAAVSSSFITEWNEREAVVLQLLPVSYAYEVLCENFEEIDNCLEALQESLRALPEMLEYAGAFRVSAFVKLSRHVNNFLCSASTFLTLSERTLKSLSAHKSSEYETWDVLRKDLHHEHFGYRLAYQLRNYVQHYHLPISRFSGVVRRSPDVEVESNLRPHIDPTALLDSGFSWKALGAEIAEHSEIDVGDLVAEYFYCLRELHLKMIHLFQDDLIKSMAFLMMLKGELGVEEGGAPMLVSDAVVEKVDDAGKCSRKYSVNYFPEQELLFILNQAKA